MVLVFIIGFAKNFNGPKVEYIPLRLVLNNKKDAPEKIYPNKNYIIGLVCLRVATLCNMHYSSNPTFFIRVLNLESELIL